MTSKPLSADFAEGYEALTQRVGLVDFSDRTQIELTGADRATFLNNFCTNAVRGLADGQGCEALVLNAKGHILGHVFVFASEKSLVIETVPAQAEILLSHLDRYLIREDVQLVDRSQEWAEILLAGPESEKLLAGLQLPLLTERLSHAAASVGGQSAWLRRFDVFGVPGTLIAFQRPSLNTIVEELVKAGAVYCEKNALEAVRIEHGFPLYGLDIAERNLPQEVDRDRWAISFTKGCYLGQETVARIDALGHVNRLLRTISFAAREVPEPGCALERDGNSAGQVTSACWSPKLSAPIALAYIRREFAQPGTLLGSPIGEAKVLPTDPQ